MQLFEEVWGDIHPFLIATPDGCGWSSLFPTALFPGTKSAMG